MKKHPIDDLFVKKLAEYRQEPSQKAFEKFQALLQEKHQKPKAGIFFGNHNWTHYATAVGIAIALSVGFLTQNDISVSPIATRVDLPIGKKNAFDTTPLTPNNQAFLSVEIDQSMLKNINKQNLPKSKIAIKSVVLSTPESNFANQNPIFQPATNKILDDSPEEQISVAINTPIFENSGLETTKPSEEVSQGIFKIDVGESVVIVFEPVSEETEVIPSINSDSNTSLEEVKSMGEVIEEKEKSFIAKLYGEYKHFKFGEKVDLKKLGVKNVLARVDESEIKEDITDVRDFVQRKLSRLQRKE